MYVWIWKNREIYLNIWAIKALIFSESSPSEPPPTGERPYYESRIKTGGKTGSKTDHDNQSSLLSINNLEGQYESGKYTFLGCSHT